jgi:hypothetical protein
LERPPCLEAELQGRTRKLELFTGALVCFTPDPWVAGAT